MHKVVVVVKHSECSSKHLKTYIAYLESRLNNVWKPVSGLKYSVSVDFAIHPGGEMSELQIEESSKDRFADQAALKSVEESSDFQAPPAEKCGKKIVFTAKFIYQP